jgi:hypothetical protein
LNTLPTLSRDRKNSVFAYSNAVDRLGSGERSAPRHASTFNILRHAQQNSSRHHIVLSLGNQIGRNDFGIHPVSSQMTSYFGRSCNMSIPVTVDNFLAAVTR